jgi:hypothetical protein
MTRGHERNIAAFLVEEGFDTPGAAARGRAVLEAAGVTRHGKQAFAANKTAHAREALHSRLVGVCGKACSALVPEHPGVMREAVVVSPAACAVCRGSNNRRAAIECIRALRHRNVRRVVLVGGTANQWREIETLFADSGIEFRLVDGMNASASSRDALANKRWAQLAIIWGPTPLRHAVSRQYTEDVPTALRIVTVPRRGIEALCDEVRRSYT